MISLIIKLVIPIYSYPFLSVADSFEKFTSILFGRRPKFADIADSLRSLRYVLGREEGYVATDGHG